MKLFSLATISAFILMNSVFASDFKPNIYSCSFQVSGKTANGEYSIILETQNTGSNNETFYLKGLELFDSNNSKNRLVIGSWAFKDFPRYGEILPRTTSQVYKSNIFVNSLRGYDNSTLKSTQNTNIVNKENGESNLSIYNTGLLPKFSTKDREGKIFTVNEIYVDCNLSE